MDYLSEESIIRTRRVNDGEIATRDVKDAVLCLMLNPNDLWARMLLILYARPDLADKSDSRSLAVQSRFAARIAHSMHKYDRERSPLLKFLLRLAALAELDVYAYLNKLRGANNAGGANAAAVDSLDYNERDGFGFGEVGDLRAESYLAKLIREKPFGGIIKFPLFEKDAEGRVTPILAPTLKMSEEELKSALVLLLQNEQRARDLLDLYRPQTPAPNPAVHMPAFTEYYEARYNSSKSEKEQRLYELVFELMLLGGRGLSDVETEYRVRYGEEPPISAKQARYSERGKRILAGFWDQFDETRKNT